MPNTDILISEKLYADLDKYAKKISERLGRKISVDQIANVSLQVGFSNPDLIDELISHTNISHTTKPTPRQTAKEGREFITLSSLFVRRDKSGQMSEL